MSCCGGRRDKVGCADASVPDARDEIADRGSHGGWATLRATAVPALMSGLDYNILGGVACTDAALRVTHPPRDPRATGDARAEFARAAMLGAARRGSRARRVGDSVLATGPGPPARESSKYQCPG